MRPESAPLLLTDLDQKLELLADCGVDYTLVIRFDEERSNEPAEDFVERGPGRRASTPRSVVVGEDFHFGHGRSGNVALLQEMGAELGFEVIGHRPGRRRRAARPSTTRCPRPRSARRCADGDLIDANGMLGRPHEVRGVVVHGDGRARELGFRTANVAVPEDICLPADGIYAGWYVTPRRGGRPTAISLGRRPTFYEWADTSLLEVHLLDFDGDLYGEPARVQFVRVAARRAEVRLCRRSHRADGPRRRRGPLDPLLTGYQGSSGTAKRSL